MCGIGYCQWDRVREILLLQQDRWLDSVGIHRLDKWKYFKFVEDDIEKYSLEISKINNSWMVLLHHRKATIWNITLANAHPFYSSWFCLLQNGTANKFFKLYWDIFKKETDTECLLAYIVRATKNISEIPLVLERLSKRIWEKFWNILVTNWDTVLFFSDWDRESYIDIANNNVKEIRNYKNTYWYNNKWYLLFSKNWEIIKNTFLNINMYINSGDYFKTNYKIKNKKHKYKYNSTLKSVVETYYKWQYDEIYYFLYGSDFLYNYIRWIITYEELVKQILLWHYWCETEEEYSLLYKEKFRDFVVGIVVWDLKKEVYI
jgi:predicted glutamine amidotransferase